MSIKLKKVHLPIVVAEPSDLPLGTLGEFITADTLKPYLDRLELSQTAAQVATAVAGLKTEILGGVDMSADSLAELNAKIGALQNITDADKTGLLAALALCVKTADIMPIVNGKADEVSVANRLASKVETNDIMPIVDAKATKVELQAEYDARIAADVRIEAIANSKTSEARSLEIADYLFGSKIGTYNQHIEAVEVIANSKVTPAEATAISEALTNALRIEMLAIEGIDDTEFARLNALLAQLTALEAGDVTGLTALLSQKVAKSDVLDGNTIGLLADYLLATNQTIGEGKIIDAIRIRNFFAETFLSINTKFEAGNNLGLAWFNSDVALNPNDTLSLLNIAPENYTEGYTFDAKVIRLVVGELLGKIIAKANSADVYTKDETFNRTQIMEGLNERATNIRVQGLESDLVTANQTILGLRTDVDLLKSYFEQAA